MHPYSIDTNERVKVITFFAFISLLISFGISEIIESHNVTIPRYLELFIDLSPAAFFSLFYKFIDNYLWKCKVFRFLFAIKAPNLNGVWEGEYESSYPSPNNTLKGHVTMTIEQTWTKIRICSKNEKSNSCSQVAGIFVNDRNGIVIKYEYENDSRNFVETMSPHTGFTKLKYNPDTNTLEGEYYTDRHRKTYGNLSYKLDLHNSKQKTA